MNAADTSTQSSSRGRRRFQELLKEARLGGALAQYDVGLMYANGVGGVQKNVAQALYWIQQSADRGHAPAQYLLGTRYSTGNGVEKSAIHALFWLQKAAAQGHPKAHHKISQLLQQQYVPLAQAYAVQAWEMGVSDAALLASQANPDPAAAHTILERAAQAGSVRAHFELARLDGADSSLGAPTAEALRHLRAAARKNYPPAVMALHQWDLQGRGRKSNSAAGQPGQDMRVVLQDAAAALDPDDVEARYCLGQMLELGIKISPSRSQALAYYRSAAAAGHALAQWALVRLGAQGAAGADEWLAQSARSGCAPAQWHWGAVLQALASDGGQQSLALSWMLKSVAAGHIPDWAGFSSLLQGPAVEGIRRHAMLIAARDGDVEAQYALGVSFVGKSGDAQSNDPLSAQTWLEKAAAQGHVLAQRELAHLLLAQSPPNAKQALHWYQQAAQAGDAASQWNVGKLFLARTQGKNGAEHLRQAYLWCKSAAEQGFVPALATLGGMYIQMGKEGDARHCLIRAAQAGDAEAQYNLSVLLSGSTLEADQANALDWLLESASKGVVVAQMRLAKIYFEGRGAPRDAVESLKWLLVAERGQAGVSKEPAAKVRAALTREQLVESERRARAHFDARAVFGGAKK